MILSLEFWASGLKITTAVIAHFQINKQLWTVMIKVSIGLVLSFSSIGNYVCGKKQKRIQEMRTFEMGLFLDQGLVSYHYWSCSCWGNLSKKAWGSVVLNWIWDEIWHNCSSSKYASIMESHFWFDVIYSRWRLWRHFKQKSAATWWVHTASAWCGLTTHALQRLPVPDP